MNDDSTPSDPTLDAALFHSGEVALQRRAGADARVGPMARKMIRDHLPDQHREFFALLPTLLVASLDKEQRPWATMLAGPLGFVSAPDEWHLRVAARPAHDDPLAAHLAPGAPLGLLGLQAHTRRRNRMNGSVVACDDAGFTVKVFQSFGNCPKYIQAREPSWLEDAEESSVAECGGPILRADLAARVHNADTFFVASRSSDPANLSCAGAGLDISHRGGKPGFVRIDQQAAQSVLVIPDFVGNFMFNTLGNLLLNPACGLLFVDYTTGGLLHLSGEAEIVHEGPDVTRYAGAQRAWRFRLQQSLWRPQALPLHWSTAELAPQLGATGDWS